jgi:hypothetical protein
LPYEPWTDAALRQVVARAIEHASLQGMPGGHHFYLTFRTDHPGVVIPTRLREQYPSEMTIVLQHQFWDLKMLHEPDAISVGLSFGGVPSTLVVPLDALIGFADPHVRFGLRFNAVMPATAVTALVPAAVGPSTAGQPTPEEEAKPADPPQVVSLDAFRRRTPPRT